jgi:hypothetical protein
MTEPDHVLDILRRARPADLPDEMASPHQPAAQAMLEEIVKVPTTRSHPVGAEHGEADDAAPPRRVRRRRRQLVVLGAAAVAVAVVASAKLVVSDPAPPSAAATIDAALATSSQALAQSGRVDITKRISYETDPVVIDQTEGWAFSGDDLSLTLDGQETERVVGGQSYSYLPVSECRVETTAHGDIFVYGPPDGAEPVWQRRSDDLPFAVATDGVGTPAPTDLDPQVLLDQLAAAGEFEDLGSEDVDGASTRHLRAVAPAGITVQDLGLGTLVPVAATAVESMEVWVDDDDLVRRIDLALSGELHFPDPAAPDGSRIEGFSYASTVEFSDLGEPITIEAPEDAVEVSPDDCGGPPEG